MRIGKAHPH